MPAFAKTYGAADYIYHHATGESTRHHALVLLRRLRACEAALASGDGRIPALALDLLPSLVPVVRELAGQAWLAAAGDDDPAIRGFTTPGRTLGAPAPAVLDEALSRVLWDRFAPARVNQLAARPGPAAGQAPVPPVPAGRDRSCRALRHASPPQVAAAPAIAPEGAA